MKRGTFSASLPGRPMKKRGKREQTKAVENFEDLFFEWPFFGTTCCFGVVYSTFIIIYSLFSSLMYISHKSLWRFTFLYHLCLICGCTLQEMAVSTSRLFPAGKGHMWIPWIAPPSKEVCVLTFLLSAPYFPPKLQLSIGKASSALTLLLPVAWDLSEITLATRQLVSSLRYSSSQEGGHESSPSDEMKHLLQAAILFCWEGDLKYHLVDG